MKKTVALIFFIVVLAFIWTNSVLSTDLSDAESSWVFKLIYPVLELVVGKEYAPFFPIRKAAHFTEFALLAFFALHVFKSYDGIVFKRILLSFFVCFTAAFLDESIQLLSGRGPAIIDVWIDLSGVFTGTLVSVLTML